MTVWGGLQYQLFIPDCSDVLEFICHLNIVFWNLITICPLEFKFITLIETKVVAMKLQGFNQYLTIKKMRHINFIYHLSFYKLLTLFT